MNYEDIFRNRGGAYHEAMRRWPDARRDEFLVPLKWAAPAPGERIVDVPAGGGYLRRYLPESSTWLGHEPCASFLPDAAAPEQGLLPLPWPAASADVAISIAGVHHLADKRPLFRELHRVVRPGGRFVLADIREHSRPARFLDEFVDRWNSTGHRGDYLDDRAIRDLRDCGFEVVRAEPAAYCWWFADRQEMGAFCRLLFDMRRIEAGDVADEIEERLGVTRAGGRIGLNWELLLVLALRC